MVLKSGSLNLLEPSGSVQTCNGIALPFTCMFAYVCLPKHVDLKVTIRPNPRGLPFSVMWIRCLVDDMEAIGSEISTIMWAHIADDSIFIVVSLRFSNLTSSLWRFHSITQISSSIPYKAGIQWPYALRDCLTWPKESRPVPQDCALAKQDHFYKRTALTHFRTFWEFHVCA
jgi:hypothetical protein